MQHISKALTLACLAASTAIGPALAQEPETIAAQVMTADGTSAGTVTFEQVEHGVVVTARLENLPEGPHAFHIHETGACEPDFQAAGGHYAPQGNEHGFDNPAGYHAGDLPNIYVEADGTATADFFAPQLTLAAETQDPAQAPFTLRDQDGSAVMIHENIDDYQAEPPDSTGDRIACGVIAEPQG